ncbi:MAG TPA: histidine phosphatase family protein [Parafilimonas sp.]
MSTKNLYKSLLAVFIIMLSNSCSAQTNTSSGLQKVVIIRHAEKPDNGDNLSCKGFNRSLELPALLYNKFKTPDKVFIPSVNNGKSANQLRMLQTITPFAVKYNLKIDSKFDVDDAKDLADAIMKTSGYVLVVWEHDKIDNIVKALGVDNKGMKWNDNDFDSIWIINFKNGKGTLTVDKENLNPPDACQ